MKSFALLDEWPCESVAAAVIAPSGEVHRHGDTTQVFALASITKLLTAAAVHLAVEEGSVTLDHEVDERGTTMADLLAHAGGLAPNGKVLDDPGRRRIYSNAGYEMAAAAVEASAGLTFADYLHEGIFSPLAMGSSALLTSPAFGAESTVDDLVRFVQHLPELLDPTTLGLMVSAHLPELIGVLPGYGRQAPNTWGLGPEIRAEKSPHWTGHTNSPSTWGHFGQTGTFLWVDPEVMVTCIVLTNHAFDEWAKPLWPAFSDAVRAELLR